MPDSMMGFLHEYELRQQNDSVTLEVGLDQITGLSHVPRAQWQDPAYQKGLIWLAGGGAYLLQNRYVVLIRRSSSAPSNPGCLTLSTGLSDGAQEWVEPNLVKREMFEEVVLLDRAQQVYFYPKCDATACDVIANALHGSPFQSWRAQGLESEFVTDLLCDKIIVTSAGKKTEFRGLLHLKGNQINFLFAIKLQLPLPISQIDFYDSEFKIKNGNKVFLNREIFLYDLKTEQVLDLKMQTIKDLPFTEHALFFIQKLCKYWRD